MPWRLRLYDRASLSKGFHKLGVSERTAALYRSLSINILEADNDLHDSTLAVIPPDDRT